jgi:hypothetical protein
LARNENKNSTDVKDQAWRYINRGWSVLPLLPEDKGCSIDEWQHLRIKSEEVSEFFDKDSNIGLLLGKASGGLTDVDLDSPEALTIGPRFLPNTLMSGRGNQITHFWYVSPDSRSKKYKDVTGETMIEIRSDGCQTAVEPSIHPSGDKYKWINPGTELLAIDESELRITVARVAVSSLIARHLPHDGRHDLALAYAGLMLRPLMELGEDKDDAVEYVWQILQPAWEYRDAPQEAFEDLYNCIKDTAEKVEADEPATGAPKLEELLEHGAAIARRIKDWLGWGELTPKQRAEIEHRKRVKRAEKAWPECQDFAIAPNLLQVIYDRVADHGLIGEERNAKLLLLAAVSLMRAEPISAIIKGVSAVGKSEIIKAVSKALPPGMVIERQSMSERSLVYMGQNGQLRNRLLVIYELGGFGKEGTEGLEMAKQLMSEGRISRETVETFTNKQNTNRTIITEGPTAMWTTTTQIKSDYELSTRVFELSPDDSQEQTGLINEKVFDYDTDEDSAANFDDVRALFTWIMGQDNRVYFPHGRALGKMLPKTAVKMRRESPRVRNLIDAHATLHQASRERDEKGRIVATLEDYEAVRVLVEEFVGATSEQAVKQEVRDTVEAAKRLIESEDFLHEGVTTTELGPNLVRIIRRCTVEFVLLCLSWSSLRKSEAMPSSTV